MHIQADFTSVTGTIKPMHGVGQPPLSLWTADDAHFHYLSEAGIPYSRLHDTGGRYGAGVYVDIPNIFRDFDADETLPESYDFRSTDRLLSNLVAYGVEPIYRLGVTIENDQALCSYRIFPPKDPAKWARICEHIIRHYNEGWADGFHFGIRYWEIWNEPDDCMAEAIAAMWHGKKEQYYELYEITANHLKACFGDTIKVGGYASCGFYGMDADPDCIGIPSRPNDGDTNPWNSRPYDFIVFFHEFLSYITSDEHKAPLDFFSWHSYADVPTTVRMEEYCRRGLLRYGLGDAENILDEWNTCHDERRGTAFASANVLAMMLAMQKTDVTEMNFYDASMGLMSYSGLFNAETQKPHLTYFTFMAFNRLYRMKQEILTSSDDPEVYVGGAVDGNRRVLLIPNRQDKAVDAVFDLTGADAENAEILEINDTYAYSPTGRRITNNTLRLPPWGCVEIRF